MTKTRLEEIHHYLMETGVDEQVVRSKETPSIDLAMKIMLYAHRDQKRENGERYSNHPYRCLKKYRKLVGIKPNSNHNMDVDLMDKYGIPYEGVQEVCLLHDVLEDSDFTFDEVRNIFAECGWKYYFDAHIATPLKNITHDKNEPYLKYIVTCMKHPTSALVKLMDLQDNLSILDLTEFNEKNYERANGYLSYMKMINDQYHFIENNQRYLQECSKKNK